MNAGFLDVLHDAADEHVAGAVTDGIDIHLDRVAQIKSISTGLLPDTTTASAM